MDVTESVLPRVTSEMNASLLCPITEEVVRGALFQMHPSKSLRPDGMSPLFYQKFWHIVGGEVVDVVRSFFEFGRLLKEVCFTHVVLVPKVKEPMICLSFVQ